MSRIGITSLGSLLLLAAGVLMAFMATRASAAGELIAVTISPASTTVAQGGQVSVPVVIESIGGVTVTGFQAVMTYDSTKLSVASCQTGVGAGANCQTGTPGVVGIGAAPALANGASVTVVTVTFNAIAAGVSPLTIGSAIEQCNASDESFNETQCVITNSSITVEGTGPTATNTVPTATNTVPTATNTVPTATNTVPTATTTTVPQPGVIRFAQSTSSVNESSPGPKTVTVRRVGGSAGEVSAICTITVLGTATNGADFDGEVNQLLTWGDGDASNKSCTYDLNQDNIIEGNETIVFSLSDGDQQENLRAEIGSPDTHVVTIQDDDFEVSPNTPTSTSTPPTIASPVKPTNTPFPTSTPTITNTPKPTDTALPTNTSSAQTHTPTATNTKPAGSATTTGPSVSATTPSGTGGTGATPRPPSAGTGNSFGGTNTLAALLLVAIGLGISGFAATRVTRKP